MISDSKSSLLKVMEFTVDSVMALANANSVLGTPIEADGMTIFPVSRLSVGFAGGGADIDDTAKRKKQNPAGAGAKVSVTPLTFLVIGGGAVHTVNVNAPIGTLTLASTVIDAVVAQFKLIKAKSDEKKQKT